MPTGVEARALLHAGLNKSKCLIVGTNIEVFFETMQVTCDYSEDQIQSALANLVSKGDFVVSRDPAREIAEYRLTETGERHLQKILRAPYIGSTRLWASEQG